MIHYLGFLVLLVLAPSLVAADKNSKYELRNIQSLKDCKCNFTLELVQRCENNDQLYNKTEMDRCIEKCSEKSTLNVQFYKSDCLKKPFKSHSLMLDPPKKCDCETSNEFRPICGNDGITYPNPSYLYCTLKCKKPELELAYDGVCQEQVLISLPNKPMSDKMNLSQELVKILKECQCAITYNFNPTCGSDGVTYINPSMFFCAKRCKTPDLKIEFFGNCTTTTIGSGNESKNKKLLRYPENVQQCLKDCDLTLEISQVCGTDGYTYNISEFSCHNFCTNENVRLKYHGHCGEECKCEAKNDLDPVCGSNGVTYFNPATLICYEKCKKELLSDLTVLHCGICKSRVNALENESISTDIEVHISSLLLSEFEKCGCIVAKEYEPICGTDGMTYENPSIFYCTRKCINPDIMIKNCGIYKKKENEESKVKEKQNRKESKSLSSPFIKCDCVATAKLYPVCGNDGVTYPHPSYLYCIKDCKMKNKPLQNLQMSYCGPCKEPASKPESILGNDEIKLSTELLDTFEKCHCNITRERNPVCGMDGVTYDNPSIFYCTRKCIRKEIHIQYCGSCQEDSARPLNDEFNETLNKCRCTATREYEPMCGDDGINYANPKVFQCAKKCIEKNMTIVYKGLCNDTPNESSTPFTRRIRSLETEIDFYNPQECICSMYEAVIPICGTDGRTYMSWSKLNCINRCKGTNVQQAYKGPCVQSLVPISKVRPRC